MLVTTLREMLSAHSSERLPTERSPATGHGAVTPRPCRSHVATETLRELNYCERYAELQLCLLFCMDVKLGRSH